MENDDMVIAVCKRMLDPASTCKACDFLQCPMLVKFSAEVKKAHECEMDVKDAEIARLKAALKPVMECDLGSPNQMAALGAVREAQRVMREGEVNV